jgi:hypothetical protein
VETDQAVIGDRHAMGIAGEIVKHLFGPAERRLRVHHPFRFRGRSEIGSEGVGIAQGFELRVEVQFTGMEGTPQLFEEESPKEPGEHAHGQEETRPASDPVLPIGGDAATGYYTVHMGMMQQGLSPSV